MATFASFFFAKVGSDDSCSDGLPSHLRRFPLKYKTWLASAESINPKRDRLTESHLSKNERWAPALAHYFALTCALAVLTIEIMKSVTLLSEEQYLLTLRERIDQLKARADLPRYKYATDDEPKLIAYFLKRAVQFGEAAFRTRDLADPLDVSMRVLCDDLIRLSWLAQSESSAAEYAKLPISALCKSARINIEKGHARIVHSPTGKDASVEFLPKLSSLEVKGKTIEEMANECGLEKLYNIIFWIGSLPVHANTYFLNDPEGELAKDALSTLPAINAFLRAIALIVDNFPNRATTLEEIMRALGMLRH